MPFHVFVAGPHLETLASYTSGIVEELAGRGIACQVLSDGTVQAEGVHQVVPTALVEHLRTIEQKGIAGFVLTTEPTWSSRMGQLDRLEEPVVVDWLDGDDTGFEVSESPHGTIQEPFDPLDGLAELFALLEGLGFVPYGQDAALSPAEEAELTDKLKELGYL